MVIFSDGSFRENIGQTFYLGVIFQGNAPIPSHMVFIFTHRKRQYQEKRENYAHAKYEHVYSTEHLLPLEDYKLPCNKLFSSQLLNIYGMLWYLTTHTYNDL